MKPISVTSSCPDNDKAQVEQRIINNCFTPAPDSCSLRYQLLSLNYFLGRMKRTFVPYCDALEMALNLLNFVNTELICWWLWWAARWRIDRDGAGCETKLSRWISDVWMVILSSPQIELCSGPLCLIKGDDVIPWYHKRSQLQFKVKLMKLSYIHRIQIWSYSKIFVCLYKVCLGELQCSVQEVETVSLHVVTISPSVPQYLSCYSAHTLLAPVIWVQWVVRIIMVTPQHPFIQTFVMLHGKFILMLWQHKSCSHTLHVSALCLSLKGFLYNANITRRGRYGDLNGVVMTGCWDLYVS